MQQILKTAIIVDAIEAMRSRKKPNEWTEKKNKRVLKAAISVKEINKLINLKQKKHSTYHEDRCRRIDW